MKADPFMGVPRAIKRRHWWMMEEREEFKVE
jgi:hypothetical protein